MNNSDNKFLQEVLTELRQSNSRITYEDLLGATVYFEAECLLGDQTLTDTMHSLLHGVNDQFMVAELRDRRANEWEEHKTLILEYMGSSVRTNFNRIFAGPIINSFVPGSIDPKHYRTSSRTPQ